jgi:hypothetical protein
MPLRGPSPHIAPRRCAMFVMTFTSKRLVRIAAKDNVYRIARLSRPSLAHAHLCLRFTRTIATAMLLAPARRPSARVLSEDPRSLVQYAG